MRQQCGADASGPPSSCEPGAPRSQALVLELSRLSRGQAQRAESLQSARVALAQLKLVGTPPDGPSRGRAKIVNSTTCSVRRSLQGDTVWERKPRLSGVGSHVQGVRLNYAIFASEEVIVSRLGVKDGQKC